MTDWRAVGTGGLAGAAYLTGLAILPWLVRLRVTTVPLLLGTGLVAGAAAGLADGSPTTGAWHGLLAGSVVGGLFAVTMAYAFATDAPLGAFHALNHVVATAAGEFPVIATHGPAVVGSLAGLGWGAIAGLGALGGRLAPMREGYAVVE